MIPKVPLIELIKQVLGFSQTKCKKEEINCPKRYVVIVWLFKFLSQVLLNTPESGKIFCKNPRRKENTVTHILTSQFFSK